jgi:hypothetical protein
MILSPQGTPQSLPHNQPVSKHKALAAILFNKPGCSLENRSFSIGALDIKDAILSINLFKICM